MWRLCTRRYKHLMHIKIFRRVDFIICILSLLSSLLLLFALYAFCKGPTKSSPNNREEQQPRPGQRSTRDTCLRQCVPLRHVFKSLKRLNAFSLNFWHSYTAHRSRIHANGSLFVALTDTHPEYRHWGLRLRPRTHGHERAGVCL